MRVFVAALALAATSAASAGTVDVQFVNPSNYTDAGTAVWDEDENAQALGRHLQRLGEQVLPAGDQLRVEVLDIDLAGTVRHGGREPVRVARGGADFPRLHLRYTLQRPGQPAVSGEDHVSDIQYTRGLANYRAANEQLYYEKRMLDAWFVQRFGARVAAAR